MDIKNKINDIKLDKIPINVMPKLVNQINIAIAEGMTSNMKLLWTDDLEYEFVEYEGNLYRDKAAQYGADSLYVLMTFNEKSENLSDYKIYAVWQNKKFLGRAEASHKTVAAILNNYVSRWQKPIWLIIKNPKIVDYTDRYTSKKSPQQQRDIDINNAYKMFISKSKPLIKRIKQYAANTPLENDNPLEIAKDITNQIFVDFDNKYNIKSNALNKYLDKVEYEWDFKHLYTLLIDLYTDFIEVIKPEIQPKSVLDWKRQEVAYMIKKSKNFPERPSDSEEMIDKSGYVVNLTKWLEKKWDKFKNSNNLLQSLIYQMQSEYNDLIFETKVSIKELMASDEKENWMKIQKFSNTIVVFRNRLNYINVDIEEFMDFYQNNNQPIDTNSDGYANIIKSIKNFIKEVKEEKELVI
jgi:hypothetical protein